MLVANLSNAADVRSRLRSNVVLRHLSEAGWVVD